MSYIDLPLLSASLIFLSLNTLIVYYLLHKYSKEKRYLQSRFRDLQEKVNILNTENAREDKNRVALEEKIKRYNKLKEITEEIDESLDLEFIGDRLTSIAFSLIAGDRGTCILYLLDNQTQKLKLLESKKEDKELTIKAKEGDVFDFWVLRHTSPLLIENIRRDFRFDPEKIESQAYNRPIASLISSPLISEHQFLGILRLDNSLPSFYSQDDLRFLVTICDLGAVALENGALFQRTKDLAIHDELTSLYTRGYFMECLRQECKRGSREDTTFSLLMLDIDYFKNYNDKFGHTSGDNVLKDLSRNITEFFKGDGAVISRFGGEEFCFILPGVDRAKAHKVADNLRRKIEKTKIILRKEETRITVSIGVASFPEDSTDAHGLILKVDQAMYQAKQKGRNRVCCI